MECANGSAFDEALMLIEAGATRAGNPEAMLRARAHYNYRRGNLEEAAENWRRLEEQDSASRRIVLIHRARIAAAEKRNQDAANFYQTVINEFGADEEACHFIIREALANDDVEAASECYDRLANEKPDSKLLPLLSAEIGYASGDEHIAIAGLEEAIISRPNDADLHLQLVDLLIEHHRDGPEIETALQRGIKANPRDSRLLARQISQLEFVIGEASQTRDEARLAQAISKVHAAAARLRAGDYTRLIAALTARRHYDEALVLLGKARKAHGDSEALTQSEALLAYRRGDYALADKLWEQLSSLSPARWRSATTHRARIALAENRRAAAVKIFADLWERHPDHDEAAQFLLRDRISGGDLRAARKIRDSIASHQKDSRLLAMADAMLAVADRDNKHAVEILETAVTRWPDQIDIRLQLIDLLKNLGLFVESLHQIDKSRERFPDDRRPIDRKIAIFSTNASIDDQLALLDELLIEFPGRIDLYVRKGRCLANKGSRHEAVMACEAGLKIDPTNVDLWRLGITSLLNLNEPFKAAEFLDAGLRNFGESDVSSLIERAELLFAGDRFADARDAALQALRLDRDSQAAGLLAARTTEAMGDWSSALKIYHSVRCEPDFRQRFAVDMGRLSKAVGYVESILGTEPPEPPSTWNKIADWGARLIGKPLANSIEQRGDRLYPHAVFEAAAAGAQPVFYDARPLIMHTTSSLGPGGAERQLTISAIEQNRRDTGYKPLVSALSLSEIGNRNFFHQDLTDKNVPVTSLSEILEIGKLRDFLAEYPEHRENLAILATLPSDALRLALPLYEQIIRHRPAVLHLWQDSTCVIGGLAGYLAGVPRMILSTRSTRPIERQRARPYLHDGFKALLSLPHVEMINNSKNGAHDYLDWLGDQEMPISTLYNGYDFEAMQARASTDQAAAIRHRLGCDDDSVLIGGVMRLSAEKRPGLWLDTAISLVSESDNYRAVLVGDGPMDPTLKQRVAELGLEGRITLAGGQTPVEPWMMAMDLLLLTSVTEGLPNVLIEAQSLGTPVASTNVGGASETLVEGETGVLVPAETSGAEIARMLWPLLEDKIRLAAMGKTASEWVTETFSIEAALDALDRIYAAAPRSEPSPSG